MTPEERSLLERTYKMSEENNSILRSMRRSNRISTIIRVCYWVLIIALSVGAYYVIQPYVGLLSSVYSGDIGNVQNAANGLKDLLKQ